MESKKKKDSNELVYKTEGLRDLENELMVAEGKGQEGRLELTWTHG